MSLPRLAPIAGAAHHTQALLLTNAEAADWLAANCRPGEVSHPWDWQMRSRLTAWRLPGAAGGQAYRCSSRKLTAQLMRLLRSLRVYWELGFSAERLSCSFRPYWTRR